MVICCSCSSAGYGRFHRRVQCADIQAKQGMARACCSSCKVVSPFGGIFHGTRESMATHNTHNTHYMKLFFCLMSPIGLSRPMDGVQVHVHSTQPCGPSARIWRIRLDCTHRLIKMMMVMIIIIILLLIECFLVSFSFSF